MKPWWKSGECLNVSTIWLDTTYPRKQISSWRNLRPEAYLSQLVLGRKTCHGHWDCPGYCDCPGHWNRHGREYCKGLYNQQITEGICPTSGQKGWEHLRVNEMVWWIYWYWLVWKHSCCIFGEFGSQVWRECEVGIPGGNLCRSPFGNQASSLRSTGWVDTFHVRWVLGMVTYNWAHCYIGWPLYLVNFFLDASDLPILPPLSALAPPPLTTTSLSSTLEDNITDDPIVFNIAVGDVAILLKSWIKRR